MYSIYGGMQGRREEVEGLDGPRAQHPPPLRLKSCILILNGLDKYCIVSSNDLYIFYSLYMYCTVCTCVVCIVWSLHVLYGLFTTSTCIIQSLYVFNSTYMYCLGGGGEETQGLDSPCPQNVPPFL